MSTGKQSQVRGPRGVSGRQRELFLSLTPEQQETYRYNFEIRGRLAAHCYRIAIGELPND